ncbi:MAG: hypothetical protein QM820_64440 [Minicystis sp.]
MHWLPSSQAEKSSPGAVVHRPATHAAAMQGALAGGQSAAVTHSPGGASGWASPASPASTGSLPPLPVLVALLALLVLLVLAVMPPAPPVGLSTDDEQAGPMIASAVAPKLRRRSMKLPRWGPQGRQGAPVA